jgi:hypothetical protein
MSKLFIPEGYHSPLDLYKTQKAISFIKENFQQHLSEAMRLKRVSAPLFVTEASGLNDNLNGTERPVSFDVPAVGEDVQVVHSLAKWKRLALHEYHFYVGNGLYTDMNAIRRDEELDNIHSIYVDQWDWERVIDESEQIANLEALMNEFIDQFRFNLDAAIDSKLVELRQEGNNHDKRVGVAADIDNLVIVARNMFGISDDDDIDDVKAQMLQTFTGKLNAVLAEYQAEYRVADSEYTGEGVDPNVFIGALSYESDYQYVTGSTARDDNYEYTDYTVDNDLIVMVTYGHADGRTRSFILNYNIYSVKVTFENGESYVIDKYDFARIDG